MKQQPSDPAYEMIVTQEALAAFVETASRAEMIAMDLEADSMFHYREKVCLIQMAANGHIVVIDPLRVKDLSALQPLFADPSKPKILHGADYDVRSLYRDFGIIINNLFDTQLASMYLGYKETGLESVVAQRFGVELNKKYQKKDWSQRPLPEDMIAYAAWDVVFLIPLAKALMAELVEKNRLAWVQEECDLLSRVRPNEQNASPLFLRIKGAGRLNPLQLAVLESLLELRDNVARQKDRPLFKIISNASLLRIAVTMPTQLKALKKSKILSDKQVVMYGKQIIEAVKRTRELEREQLPRYPRNKSPRLSPRVPLRVKALRMWRDRLAESMALDPALLLNRALIRDIAVCKPGDLSELKSVPGLHHWQAETFGPQILEVLKKSRI